MPSTDRAKIVAPPPLLALACIGLAYLARHFEPLPIVSSAGSVKIIIGIVLFITAIAIVFTARKQMIAIGTHPNPYRPTMAVSTTGVYRFSRNPIYIAFMLVLVGFAFCANSWWFIIADALLFLLLHFGVVKREERYLSEKFGETYRDYCLRVRRWL